MQICDICHALLNASDELLILWWFRLPGPRFCYVLCSKQVSQSAPEGNKISLSSFEAWCSTLVQAQLFTPLTPPQNLPLIPEGAGLSAHL